MATRIYQAIYFTSNVSHIPDAAVDEVIDDTLTRYASYNRVTVSAEYCTLCLRYSEHPALPLISSWKSSSASTRIFVYKMYTLLQVSCECRKGATKNGQSCELTNLYRNNFRYDFQSCNAERRCARELFFPACAMRELFAENKIRSEVLHDIIAHLSPFHFFLLPPVCLLACLYARHTWIFLCFYESI